MKTGQLLLLVLFWLSFGVTPAGASSWSFLGKNYYVTSGTSYGNSVTFYDAQYFSPGLAQLRVTGFGAADSAQSSTFDAAYIRRFIAGLGVCNREEGLIAACISGGVDHQTDNVGQQDVVMFWFDAPQTMESLTIAPVGIWDRDVSFWVGTVSPSATLNGLSIDSLGSLGFGAPQSLFSSPGSTPITLALGGLTGNALLIGALLPADGSPDRFKIQTLVTSPVPVLVPLPGAFWLLLLTLGALRVGFARRGG